MGEAEGEGLQPICTLWLVIIGWPFPQSLLIPVHVVFFKGLVTGSSTMLQGLYGQHKMVLSVLGFYQGKEVMKVED